VGVNQKKYQGRSLMPILFAHMTSLGWDAEDTFAERIKNKHTGT